MAYAIFDTLAIHRIPGIKELAQAGSEMIPPLLIARARLLQELDDPSVNIALFGQTPSARYRPGRGSAGAIRLVTRGVAAISLDPSKTSSLTSSMLTVTEQMWHGWLAGGALTSQADELPEIRIPTCYILGGKDVLVDQAKQLDDVRRIPGGRAVLLSELGHLCGPEMPDVVANEISNFLETEIRADRSGLL